MKWLKQMKNKILATLILVMLLVLLWICIKFPLVLIYFIVGLAIGATWATIYSALEQE